MEPGKGRSFWWTVWIWFLAGCAAQRSQVDRALSPARGPSAAAAGAVEPYAVHCPDVLQVTLADQPDLSGPRVIGADGRIDLGPLGRLRVEGQTPNEIVRRLAAQTGIAADRIHVDVTSFNSQQVYVFGQVRGLQRAVPYHGPETVLDLLQRLGGVTAGAAPHDVYVVRSHVTEGGSPEVFHINLRSIVLSSDPQTTLRLQPFDQVYVGESRQASLAKCVPPCLRPLYETICGLRRHSG
jgi:protein involved in polysaccharide export with SLBB domain